MEGPERLVANWGAKGLMADLSDLWTDDQKADISASDEAACKDSSGAYYEFPLCMTARGGAGGGGSGGGGAAGIDFLYEIMERPDYQEGDFTIQYLDKVLEERSQEIKK